MLDSVLRMRYLTVMSDKLKLIRGAQIKLGTVKQIAELVARFLLTEKEACLKAGVNLKSWYDWKARNKRTELYARILEQMHSNQIITGVSRIEDCAHGRNGAKYPDWRASQYLLQVKDKRFRDQRDEPRTVNNTLVVVHDALKRAYSEPGRALIDLPRVIHSLGSRIPPRRIP